MNFYYRTSAKEAEAILSRGFEETAGNCSVRGTTVAGVLVSDKSTDDKECATGGVILEIRMRVSKKMLAEYEVKKAGQLSREWCFPADLLSKGKTILKLSETELVKKYNWWWRDHFVEPRAEQARGGSMYEIVQALQDGKTLDLKDVGPAFHALHIRYEWSARLYEMAKRLMGKYEFDKSWPQLSLIQKKCLFDRWPGQQQLALIDVELRRSDNPSRIDFTHRFSLSFNLNVHDEILAQYLLTHIIQPERKRLGIPNPPPNQNARRHGLSWRAIELWDKKHSENWVLNRSESSCISKAIYLAGSEGGIRRC
jgi:hypothetical protein